MQAKVRLGSRMDDQAGAAGRRPRSRLARAGILGLLVTATTLGPAQRTSAYPPLLGSFDPDLGTLVGIGFDDVADTVFIYPDFDASIHEYMTNGTPVDTIPRPGASSNDFDLDFAPEAMNVGGTAVAANTLLVSNGETDPETLFALDKDDGTVLDSQTLPISGQTTGASYHAARDSLFATDWSNDLVVEIDPSDGTSLNSFAVAPAGSPAFDLFFSDVEVEPSSGNLLLVSDSQDRIREMTPTGAFVTDHDVSDIDTVNEDMTGIAVDDSTGEIWLSSLNGKVYHVSEVRAADLRVTKWDSGREPKPVGASFRYGIRLKNLGPDGATEVTLVDTLPDQVSFVSYSASQGTCVHDGGVVTCDLGSVASEAFARVSILVVATGSGTATNTVTISAAETEPVAANNSDTEDTTISS